MSPPCTPRARHDGHAGRSPTRPASSSIVTIEEILHDTSHELGVDPGLQKDGVEAHLQELLAEHVDDARRRLARWSAASTRPRSARSTCSAATPPGAAVAVEIKRRGEIDGVEQLTRYLELLNRDPLLAPVKGVFAAQEIKPQARVLAADRGIDCVTARLRQAARHRAQRHPVLGGSGGGSGRLPVSGSSGGPCSAAPSWRASTCTVPPAPAVSSNVLRMSFGCPPNGGQPVPPVVGVAKAVRTRHLNHDDSGESSWPDQALRRRAGGRRNRPGHSRGRGVRDPRPERGGKVHHGGDPGGIPHPGRRRGERPGHRPGQADPRVALPARHRAPNGR